MFYIITKFPQMVPLRVYSNTPTHICVCLKQFLKTEGIKERI